MLFLCHLICSITNEVLVLLVDVIHILMLFLFLVFALFCWSGVIDLFIALELDGYVSGYMQFYFLEGEPYLNTSHGTMINYWDGTVHYTLQLSGIILFCLQYVSCGFLMHDKFSLDLIFM